MPPDPAAVAEAAEAAPREAAQREAAEAVRYEAVEAARYEAVEAAEAAAAEVAASAGEPAQGAEAAEVVAEVAHPAGYGLPWVGFQSANRKNKAWRFGTPPPDSPFRLRSRTRWSWPGLTGFAPAHCSLFAAMPAYARIRGAHGGGRAGGKPFRESLD